MPKKSNKGIKVFEIAGKIQKRIFLKKLKKLGFKEFTAEQKLIDIIDNDRSKPKRATSENVLQKQYRLVSSKSDYYAHIHTGMIGDDFAITGAGWVIVGNDKNKDKIFWLFPRNFAHSLLFRLGAYAELCKKILEYQPTNTELVEAMENVFCWRSSGNDTPINFKHYALSLEKNEYEYIRDRERTTSKWLLSRPGQKRRRDIRRQWKDKNKK